MSAMKAENSGCGWSHLAAGQINQGGTIQALRSTSGPFAREHSPEIFGVHDKEPLQCLAQFI